MTKLIQEFPCLLLLSEACFSGYITAFIPFAQLAEHRTTLRHDFWSFKTYENTANSAMI